MHTNDQMGCFQREAATELKVSQSVISRMQQRHRATGRVTEMHRSERPLATSHVDDRFIAKCTVELVYECHSTPGTFKGSERHPSVTSDHSKPLTSAWSAC